MRMPAFRCLSAATLTCLAAGAWPGASWGASTTRGYLASPCDQILVIDGEMVPYVTAIDGGEWREGRPASEPLVVEAELFPSKLTDWVRGFASGGEAVRKDIDLYLAVPGGAGAPGGVQWHLQAARITKVALDDLDGSSKVAWHFAVTIQADSTAIRRLPTPPVCAPADRGSKASLGAMASNYQVSLGALPANRVAKISHLEFTAGAAAPLLTISWADFTQYVDWQVAASEGRPAIADPLVLQLKSPNLQQVLATVTMNGVRLVRLGMTPMPPAAGIRRFDVELGVARWQFDVAGEGQAPPASPQSTQPATQPVAPPALPPPLLLPKTR